MMSSLKSKAEFTCHIKVVVERVAKSRVSNRSDSKKSDSGKNFKKSVFFRVSCTFYSKFYVLFHKAGFG